jgi:peptide/nickel transport system permease protein
MNEGTEAANPLAGRTDPLEALAPRRRSEWERTLVRFSRNLSGLVGLILVLIVIVSALAAPLLTQADPNDTDVRNAYAPASRDHPFGTDNLGRDVFSRVLYGARVSVGIGLAIVAITTLTGPTIGFLAGYFSRLDGPLMRLIDMLNAIPAILLALAIVAILGPQLINIVIAVSIVLTTATARVVRSVVLQLKEMEFVQAARAIGASDGRIIKRHLLPNTMPPLIVQQSLVLAMAILAEASLTFLGLGGAVETPTLGYLIAESRNNLQAHPMLSVYPGAAIFLFVLGANLLGDGLRDVLDPRMRR